MARHALFACCVCGLVIGGMVFADIVPLPNFKNPEAKKAKSRYDEAVARAKTDYEQKLREAREALLADLDKAQKDASNAGDLDEAVKIRDARKVIAEGARDVATKADLRNALAGTRWNWGDVPLVLQADGRARHALWEADKLLIRWEAIDRRTALLVIEKGRDHHTVAVLEFSEAIDEFKGFDFGGRQKLETKKRLPPGTK